MPLIKLKELKKYFEDIDTQEMFNHISYRRYSAYIGTLYNHPLDRDYGEYKNSNVCIKIFKKYDSFLRKIYEKQFINEISEKSRLIFHNYFRLSYYENLSEEIDKDENNLVIFNSTNQEDLDNYHNFINCDFAIIPNNNLEKKEFKKFEESVNKLIYKKYKINFLEETEDLLNFTTEKRDNIIIKLSGFKYLYSIMSYSLLTFPSWLITVYASLKNLKKDGNLYLSFYLVNVTKSYEKLIEVLISLFKRVEYNPVFGTKINLGRIMVFHGFKDNFVDDKLYEICNQCLKYNYSYCDYFNYWNSNPEINYFVREEDRIKPFSNKKILIVDDIKIKSEPTPTSKKVINTMKNFFNHNINIINAKVNSFTEENIYGEVKVDKFYLEQKLYERLLREINILYRNNIPFNRSYLAYIKKFNKNIFNKYFSVDKENQIYLNIINFTNPKFIIKETKSYDFIEFEKSQELLEYQLKIKEKEEDRIIKFRKKIPLVVKTLSEDFTRGVKKYINENFNLEIPVSNAFVKLWEIYNKFPFLLKNKKNLYSFHFAEAPGQWIYCTETFISVRRDNIVNYIWKANSLNPYSEKVKEKFGNVLKDDYGYIRNNRNKWIFGKDDTGDITNPDNIKYFKKYFQDFNLNLVTSDGGIITEDIKKLQKLELSQVLTVLATLGKKGCCVVKHFLPFVPGNMKTFKSNGFFVNFVYLYYIYFENIYLFKPLTSSPNSSEFYIIGKNFKGIDEKDFEKLLTLLRNFKQDICFFEKESIEEEFLFQILDFSEKLNKINYDSFQTQISLLTCINTDDPIIKKESGCENFLNIKFLKRLQNKRFEKWIDFNNFN